MVVGLATLTNESLWTLTSVAVVKINTSGSVSACRFQTFILNFAKFTFESWQTLAFKPLLQIDTRSTITTDSFTMSAFVEWAV